MDDFDAAYRSTPDYFGAEPEPSLVRFSDLLEPGELTGLFPDLSPVHTWEGTTPEHRHGDGPSERHGLAEAVLRRP